MSEVQMNNANNTAVAEKQNVKVLEATPDCDIQETKDSYIVTVDMPGMQLDQIHVDLDRDMLTVEGTAQIEGLDPRHYMRQFRVMRGLDASRVQADYKLGVLTLSLAKPSAQQPKQIKITCG